jgi:MFS family permease
MDRQILAILLEPIRREVGASDTEMGLLTGFAFVLFFALASVPIARAGDRYSRRNIIAVALTFWSLTTMLSGYVATFLQLFLSDANAALSAGHFVMTAEVPSDAAESAIRGKTNLEGTRGGMSAATTSRSFSTAARGVWLFARRGLAQSASDCGPRSFP